MFWLLLLISINIWFINCKTVEINSGNTSLFLRTEKSRLLSCLYLITSCKTVEINSANEALLLRNETSGLLSCLYLITNCKTAEIITDSESQYISFKILTNWTNAPHDIHYHIAHVHPANRTISQNVNTT
jgi:hypothetical protein